MALILAADTSTSVNTVALCASTATGDVEIRVETVVECARGHAERLIETVDWVLQQAGTALAEIDLLAISVGPGSFTGLRIGVATWKGLAFAAHKPLYGVPTLDALAQAAGGGDGLVCPLIDARMGEVYGALYRYHEGLRETLIPARACTVEDFFGAVEGPVTLLGDGASRYRERIEAILPGAKFASAWRALPRAAAVAAEAVLLAAAGASGDADAVAPAYLRKAKVDMRGAEASAAGKVGTP